MFSSTSEGVRSCDQVKCTDLKTERSRRTSLVVSSEITLVKLFTSRWLGFWLDSLGAFIVFFAALFAVAERGNITGGLAGVALTYAMQVRSLNICEGLYEFATVSTNHSLHIPLIWICTEMSFQLAICAQTLYSVNMMVRGATELETHIVSVERIKEYTEIQSEVRTALSVLLFTTIPHKMPHHNSQQCGFSGCGNLRSPCSQKMHVQGALR